MKLTEKRIAILTEQGFEEVELTEPQKALEDVGAKTFIISTKSGKIKSWDSTDWGKEFEVDQIVSESSVDDFDALLLPGGVINPDKLRTDKDAVNFIKEFVESGKPVAAICHAPLSLIEANVVDGKRLTSYHSIKTDMHNAGVNWVDEEVVIDGNLITSRNPDDIPAFNKALITALEN